MKINIDKYRTLVDSRINESEDDLILHAVMPLLNDLGYELDYCKIQKRAVMTGKITDIFFHDAKDNKLIVEVKKATEKIDKKHLFQLSAYLNSLEVEWGIITNGYEWILLNNKIKETDLRGLQDRIVFHVDLRKNRVGPSNGNNIKKFCYEWVFKSKISYYYKLLQQYKVYLLNQGRLESSFNTYRGTLNRFINYMIYRYNRFYSFSNLEISEFIDFAK